MKPDRISVFAITLNWNSYDSVVQCVGSLKKSAFPVRGIIIVDNGSKDGSGEQLSRKYKRDRSVVVVRNDSNEGFSRAVNKGMDLAIRDNATHIFLLNNDAIVDAKCLGFLIHTMRSDTVVGASSPTVFYQRYPTRIWHGSGYFSYVRANVVVPNKDKILTGKPGEPMDVTFLSGCVLLLKTAMLKDIGLLDEDFFFYGEDVEFSLRAIRKGYKLLYVPRAFAWHEIDDISTSRSSPYVMYHRARSSTILFRKSFPRIYAIYAAMLHLFVYTPYRIWQCRNAQKPYESFSAWIRGTIDGLLFRSRNWVG